MAALCPGSWAGTPKPLVVWSNQGTVTWYLCDANPVVGCGHPLRSSSVGHTALSPSDLKNSWRNHVVTESLQPKSPPTVTSKLEAALCISPY